MGLDGIAHFSDANALRFLPREQQLHAVFDGVLRLPHHGVEQHGDTGWIGTQSHYGRIPAGLLDLPLDDELDNVDIQSQHYNIPADRGAPHDGDVRAVPYKRKLFRHAANGL
jgi:hypothetical protein